MKVSELILELKKLDPNKEVYILDSSTDEYKPILSIYVFSKDKVQPYLYKEDKKYRENVDKILNSIILA